MRGGLSIACAALLLGGLLLAPGANATETALFHREYSSPLNGNRADPVVVPEGFDFLRLTVNITAGDGFWSDVRGYASLTVLDPNDEVKFHAAKLVVLPIVWGPLGDPFAPYSEEWTVELPPLEGEWTVVEVHATPGLSIFVTADLVGVTEA